MTGFNPGNPGVIGVEWPVTVESSYTIDSPTKAIGASVLSTAADTVDKASVYISATADHTGFARVGQYVMDVWPLSSVAEDPTITTQTFAPNQDVTVTTLNRTGGGAAAVGTAFTEIDEVGAANLADWIRPNAATQAEWRGRAAVGVGNLAGKQIIGLATHFYMAHDYTSYGSASTTPTAYLNIGGVKYTQQGQAVTSNTPRDLVYTWEYNPSSNKPWTIADVEHFDVDYEYGLIWGDGNQQTVPQAWHAFLYQSSFTVDSVPENRVATGVAGVGGVGWTEFDLSTPTGGTTWAKANGTEYLFTLRRLFETSPGASDSFRYLDSGVDAPNGNHAYAPQFDGIGGRFLSLGARYTRAHSLVVTTSAPATSVDSQPYALRTLAGVWTGHTIQSEFLGVAASYGVVKFMAASQAGVPTADLLVKIKRRSDNVQLGTTMTVTAASLTGTPTTLRQITTAMAATALAAVQYYVEFSTTAANGHGWVIAVLDTTGTGSSATYGGTGQAATIGGVEDTDMDAAVFVAQIPATPAAFARSVLTQAATGHQYVHLTWTATALGASFSHYEIERLGIDGVTWYKIANITTESVAAFDDYEGRRGILASYRMRVVHINTVPSSYTATLTAQPQANGHRMALVSNEAPTLNVNYFDGREDASPERRYNFLDHPVTFDLEDTDGSVEFRSTNRRGEEFTLLLIVGHLKEIVPAAIGRQAFDPLLALINNALLSYVCVLDWDGNRWYATCDIIDGTRKERGGRYFATVNVRTLQFTPSAPDST